MKSLHKLCSVSSLPFGIRVGFLLSAGVCNVAAYAANPDHASEPVIRVNAGGSAYTDSAGNLWDADRGYNTGREVTTSSAITGTVDEFLFQSAHWDPQSGDELEYRFEMPNGNYWVNLYFADIYKRLWGTGARIFDVALEGEKVLDDFDIYGLVGGNAALVKSFPVKIQDGELNIAFSREVGNPKISAIEIVAVADPDPQVAVGEAGTVHMDQADGDTWHTVELTNSYEEPVVIMQTPSYRGGDPTTIRLRNVTGTSFEWQLDEWDYRDGGHIEETVGYVVVEAGTHTLGDGSILQAATVKTNHDWAEVVYPQAHEAPPVVLTQSQTYEGPQAAVTRQQSVTASSFQVRLQEEEGNDGNHAVETIGWLAFTPGQGSTGTQAYEAALTGDKVTDADFTVGFTQSFDAVPVFLAGLQSMDGSDPASLRHDDLGTTGVTIFVEEEQSADEETGHTTENVGYLAIEPGSLLASQVDGVVKDKDSLTVETQLNEAVHIDVVANRIWSSPAHGTAVVKNDGSIAYTPDENYAGSDRFHYEVTDGDGNHVIKLVSIQVDCETCAAGTHLVLSWEANAEHENVEHYSVYKGATANDVNERVSELMVASAEFDATAPAVEYDAWNDLRLNTGDNVCFRIKAINSVGESAFSDAACSKM